MHKYLVRVQGNNFLLQGETGRYGFYRNMYVKASDPKAATLAAVDLIRKDRKFRKMVVADAKDKATLDIDDVKELESFEECDLPGGSYHLYPEKDTATKHQTTPCTLRRIPHRK